MLRPELYLETGAVAPRTPNHLKKTTADLVNPQAEDWRTPITRSDVGELFKKITGVNLKPGVAGDLGFDRITKWQLVQHPDVASVVIAGTKEGGGEFGIQEAVGTIALIRDRVFLPDRYYSIEGESLAGDRVWFQTARLAGLHDTGEGNSRLIEVSYSNLSNIGNDGLYNGRTAEEISRKPEELVLSHIGFSVTNKEFPELNPQETEFGVYHIGESVVNPQDSRYARYTPDYRTYPARASDIDDHFDIVLPREWGYVYGSIVTGAMAKEVGQASRIVRTGYFDDYDPAHQVFLGQNDDLGRQAGLFAEIQGKVLRYGLNPRKRMLALGDAQPWQLEVPLYLTR